jgi:predicted acyltransferase
MSAIANLKPAQQQRIQRVRQLARLLDEAILIPGTNKRIGLDPIIGLIPGGGDTITMLMSGYIVVEAARLGLPRNTLFQMVGNIAIDAVVGTVPVVGDLFDVVSKANMRNLKLLDGHLAEPDFQAKPDKLLIILIVALLGIIIISFGVVIALIFSLFKALWG